MTAGDLITATQQIEWRSTLWGFPATSVSIANLVGWLDLPAMRGSNAERPGRHGSLPGLKRAGERTIEVELTDLVGDPTVLPGIIAATALAEDPVEEPLVIWAGTDAPQLVTARLERRSVPTDHEWSVGSVRAVLQWVATDPRRYSVAQHTQTVGLPAPVAGGLAWPAVWPLDWGAGVGGGQMVLSNVGSVPTWPVWQITGPITGPIITNTTTGDKLLFDPTWTLPAGQTVILSTDLRSVDLLGTSQRNRLLTSQWFSFLPGSTTVAFTSVGSFDPAASLTAIWRDAYL